MKINQGQKTLLGMGEFTEKEFAQSVNELADHFGEGFFVSSPSEWEKASQTATIQYGEEKDEAFSLHHLSDGSVVLEERFGEVSQAFLSHFWEVLEHTFRLSRLPKLHALTRVRYPEFHQTDYFLVQNDVKDSEKAFRNAIDAFLSTDVGKILIESTDEDFNWGDAVTAVPDPYWEEEGIQKVTDDYCYETFGVPTLITVNQDEVLVEDKHFAEEV